MSDKSLSEDVLRQIAPTAAQQYALSRGWRRIDIPTRFKVAVYRRDGDRKNELRVPQTKEFADYPDRIADFIRAAADFEGISVERVLSGVLFPSADVLRFGYESPRAKLGVIPLPAGMSLFSAAWKSVSSATYDTLRPEKFHARMSNPAADAYIQSCQMGQTERASFVVSCICPVEPISQLPLDDEEENGFTPDEPAFGRQVTQRLMKSLNQTVEYIMGDRINQLVEPAPDDITISGNFFESILSFPIESEENSLYVSCAWDANIPIGTGPDRVELRYDFLPAIEQVARQLRPRPKPRNDRFIGHITALRGEANADELMEGEVILSFADEDSLLKAKVRLNADDYARACDAHKDNKYVGITGTLIRSRKSAQIDAYSDFQPID